jgi:hypothetical protein
VRHNMLLESLYHPFRRGGHAMAKKQAQALAIKLSRERRAGKEIPPPPKGKYSKETRQRAARDIKIGRQRKTAAKRHKR